MGGMSNLAVANFQKEHASDALMLESEVEHGRRLTGGQLKAVFGLCEWFQVVDCEESSKLPQKPLPVTEYVQQAFETLGITVTPNRREGCIELHDNNCRFRKWIKNFDLKVAVTLHFLTVETYKSASEERQALGCWTLSSLRRAISAIKKAKIRNTFRRSEKRRIRSISAWSLASAIVLELVIEKRIDVYETTPMGLKWYRQWVSSPGRRKRSRGGFLINLPLRLEKGLSMIADDTYGGSLVIFVNVEQGIRITRLEEIQCHDIYLDSSRRVPTKALRVGNGGYMGTMVMGSTAAISGEVANSIMSTKVVYLT